MQKIFWMIALRWVVFSIIFIVVPLILLFKNDLFIPNLSGIYWILAIMLLGNAIFTIFYRFFKQKYRDDEDRIILPFLFSQVALDYILVSIFLYLYGFTPIDFALFYLPHIIIVSIVCERISISYAITALGLGLTYLFMFLHRAQIAHDFQVSIINLELLPVAFLIRAAFYTMLFSLVSYLTKILVQNLIQINQQLVKLDKEKQSYALRATHELKAPFAAIQSYVQVIRAGYVGEVSPAIKDILNKIHARCELLTQMIKNIIQLSNLRTSIYAGNSFVEIDLEAFLGQKLVEMEIHGREKGITLSLQSERVQEGIKVWVVKDLFSILVDNLILNAIKYSGEKGKKVEIFVSMVAMTSGSLVALAVKDEGIGIPEEHLENIFKEHFRCNNGVENNRSGNGMGLAIVKEISRIHHGSIQVTSTLGEGSCFVFTFPIRCFE
ncbi:MAG: HAMP domain-containing histidine kinase [Oligoflexia bacterium]|nr:HAMP domain-containing histidine kinase [Oligoflexia bacterium]MBF0366305.1 HAMP domain-containing histidine kinase [Oligoflexia bacterium]